MLKIRGNRRSAEVDLAMMLAGEAKWRVYLNFPVRYHTRKLRGTKWYLFVNAPAHWTPKG